MIEKLICDQMADLTYGYCKTHCRTLGSCCHAEYCNLAAAYAQSKGVIITQTLNPIPYLDDDGKCIMPPEYRLLCTIQQCDIGSLGFFKDDPDGMITREYYTLRALIDKQMGESLENEI